MTRVTSVVRLLDRPARPPGTPIERRLVDALRARGPLPRSVLVSVVALAVYRDELAHSGWLVDLGFLGEGAFAEEVVHALDAGCGVLWECPEAAAQPEPRRGLAMRRALLAVALLLGAGLAPPGAAGAADVSLLTVSDDPTRELYQTVNAAFARRWKARTGDTVTVRQSHGGSGKQARSVIDGPDADVGPGDAPAVGYGRPHDLEVVRQRNGHAVIEVVVRHVVGVGPRVRLELERRDGHDVLEADLSREASHALDLRVGDAAFVRPRALRVWGEEPCRSR